MRWMQSGGASTGFSQVIGFLQDLRATAGQYEHAAEFFEPHVGMASHEKWVNDRGPDAVAGLLPVKKLAEKCQLIFGIGVGAVHRMLSSNSNGSMLPDIQELRGNM